MKTKLLLSIILISSSVFALEGLQNVAKINAVAKDQAMARKFESRLAYEMDMNKLANKKIQTLLQDNDKLASDYRAAITQNQFLKLQNNALIETIKKNGNFTQELAEKYQPSTNRMPASVQDNKSKK
ncbi:hypothetical protein [Bacteriovorax sp. Seq25_V]|uniref:hypothetical protein n=1 Tax=Bacteriovorax sp. Seq25_V TaxID=1201288 RepID=UPI00038A28A0|nr:hypothetical protein [Bacteriovorax sp. Seq25_V]EQC46521.1 hypothetical protein M900_2430 [Bacteriovorax sp. Seq25_V]